MISFLLAFLLPTFAQQACFCEIGDWPVDEQKYFKWGCEIWLSKQKNCQTQQIVAQNTDYLSLPLPASISALRIGYVGHWWSAQQTVSYLQNSIEPLLKARPVSVSVDNTACLGMNPAEVVFDYIRGLRLGSEQTLQVKANQTNSLGEWQVILGQHYNFYAIVSSAKNEIEFPSCDDFEHYPCMEKYQAGDSGRCLSDGQLQTLYCCDTQTEIGPELYQWEQRSQCVH